jgi:hypothetical protein
MLDQSDGSGRSKRYALFKVPLKSSPPRASFSIDVVEKVVQAISASFDFVVIDLGDKKISPESSIMETQ